MNVFEKWFLRRSFTPEKVIIFTSSVVAVIFCCIIFGLSSKFYGKIVEEVQDKFQESYQIILDDSENIVEEHINLYNKLLMSWYDKSVFDEGTSEDIRKYLMDRVYKMPQEFHDIFYFDKPGNAYSIFGTVVPIADRDYYKAVFEDKKEFFISEGVYSRVTNAPIFILSNAIYDSEGNLKGALCVSIENSEISKHFESVNTAEFGAIAVLDQKGKYIIHKDPSQIYHTYTPSDSSYESSEEYVKNHQDNETFISLSPEGEQVFVTLKSISGSGWRLALFMPCSQIKTIYIQRAVIKYSIVIVSLLALCLLIYLEYRLTHYFQRKKMLELNFDPITKLYTREKYESEALKLIKKHKTGKFILIESDIRGFKYLNKNYGEEEGNKILNEFAEMISDAAAYHNGICGRGYADHFYSLFEYNSEENAMSEFKETINLLVERFKKSDIPIRLKFGISYGEYNEANKIPAEQFFQDLINNAALAKSTIQNNIQENYAICDKAMSDKNKQRYVLEQAAEDALKNGEFFVMYQPKMDLKTKKISGAEALVRWNRPGVGIIPPDDFIPIFEKNGFVTKIDFYVYNQVFKFLDNRLKNGLPVVPVSVNMSRNHHNADVFMRDFMNDFHKYNIPAKYIQIEILERSAIQNDILVELTERLQKEGFTVAMDDFGSGESSLNMLATVPVNVIKFDRYFLLSATDSNGKIKDDKNFIKSLLTMGNMLGKETIFEGVETDSQTEFLEKNECGFIQGYRYSKPLAEEDFSSFIEEAIK